MNNIYKLYNIIEIFENRFIYLIVKFVLNLVNNNIIFCLKICELLLFI